MAVTPVLLRGFDVLASLPEPALEELAARSTLRSVARRAIILDAGSQGDAVCFLLEGRLQGVDFTLDGREVGLYFVDPGEFCGEVSLFDQGPHPEHIIALARSRIVMVPTGTMRHVMFSSRPLMEALTCRLAGRVRELTAHRALLSLNSVPQRVCGQLWSLLQSSPDPEAILLPPTHQEMAIMLNLSRESVTRAFQTLQARAVVQRDGANRLKVLDAQLLEELALGDEAL